MKETRDQRYGFLWIIVWNLYEICMDLFVWIFFMDTRLEV